MRLLVVLALAACGACGGGAVARPAHRLLVVGWDGATFDLLDPLLEAGRLPNVQRLMERGRAAVLESTAIPISSAAWTAAMTGMGPGESGVYGFFEPVPGSYDVRLIDSTSNRAAPLWRILSGRGLGVHVFGVPVTFPPEPINGRMVAGMLAPHDAQYAWPASYADELRARGFVPDLGIWRETQPLDWQRVLDQLALKERALRELLARDDWDCAVAVFKNLDVVSHQVYDGRLDTRVADLCCMLDTVLGRLLETVGEDTNVLLVSDHGFATFPKAFNLHRWLIDEGFAAPGAAAPDGAPGGPLAEARPAEHRRRLGALDMTRTRAFATDCEGSFGSLRLNAAGREPAGVVTAAERATLLDDLTARLLAYAPVGTPLVKAVWRGAELYPGPYQDRLVPDLVFETTADHRVVASVDPRVLSSTPAPFPDHARAGVLVAAGPDIARASERATWSVLDVAPTALHLLEQPVHLEVQGRVRAQLLAVPRPVRRVAIARDPTYRTPEEAQRPMRLTPAQVRAKVEELASSGYAGGLDDEAQDGE
jgi:predicted AlkP superfamily phosphohydrolase/phosphomutase